MKATSVVPDEIGYLTHLTKKGEDNDNHISVVADGVRYFAHLTKQAGGNDNHICGTWTCDQIVGMGCWAVQNGI